MGVIHQATTGLGVPATKYWYRLVLGPLMRGGGGGGGRNGSGWQSPQQQSQQQQRGGGGPDYQVCAIFWCKYNVMSAPALLTAQQHLTRTTIPTAHPAAPPPFPNLPTSNHPGARRHLFTRRNLPQPAETDLPDRTPAPGLGAGGCGGGRGESGGVGGGGDVPLGLEFVQDRGGARCVFAFVCGCWRGGRGYVCVLGFDY